MSEIPAYRLIVRVKNNRLWRAIVKKWPDITTQAEAARRTYVHQAMLGRILNIQEFPGRIKPDGIYWNDVAFKISAALDQEPEFLFDPRLYGRCAETQIMEIEDFSAIKMLPGPDTISEVMEFSETATSINKALAVLTPREERILRSQYGINEPERTLTEIAKQFGLSNQRVRQIVLTAMWKLPESITRKILVWPDELSCAHQVLHRNKLHVCAVCKRVLDRNSVGRWFYHESVGHERKYRFAEANEGNPQ